MIDIQIGDASDICSAHRITENISENTDQYWVRLEYNCLTIYLKIDKKHRIGVKLSNILKSGTPDAGDIAKGYALQVAVEHMTPDHIISILKHIKSAYENGIAVGAAEAKAAMRDALGL